MIRRSASVLVLVAACSEDGALPCATGHNTRCATASDTCATDDERCTCTYGYWACEPTSCPLEDAQDGDPCTEVGLRCDTGFEDPGAICVGPEREWAVCRFYGGIDETRNGCPATPPALGGTCCQGLGTGGAATGCAYGAETYDCVGDHWVLTVRRL